MREMECVWFGFLLNIKESMSNSGMSDIVQKEIIQELKAIALRELNLRGNMLNMREKHIPQVQGFYDDILKKYIISD